jgi:hypothetical protein
VTNVLRKTSAKKLVSGLWEVADTPASRLGVIRALVGGYTLYYLFKRRDMFRRVVRTDPELFAPVGPVRVLPKPIPAPVADVLNDATLVSTALFTLGSGHKIIGKVHSTLLLWTLSYRNSWSMIFHSDNTLVFHTIALGLSRSADAVSLDSMAAGTVPEPHRRYGWPIKLMNSASTITYMLAGVAKVLGPSGWSWANGVGMRRQVAVDGIRKEVAGSRGAEAGYQLYKHKHMFTGMAASSLILEIAAPLALLNRRLGKVWAVSAYGMHVGIRVIMGIKFRYQLSGVSFAPWFDVERVLKLLRRG